jgi:integrase
MGLSMPSPVLVGNTFYLRVRVPSELVSASTGRIVAVPVGETIKQVVVKKFVKVSLGTRDPKEAKRRFASAYAAVQEFWSAIKEGPKPLTHKQSLALAGEIRAAFISAFDNNPGEAETWERAIRLNDAAIAGRLNPLTISTLETQARDLDKRFGPMVDGVLATRGVIVEERYRPRLLQHVAEAMSDMARVNLSKARGDYSDSGESKKYPTFEKATPVNESGREITFKSVIDTEVRRRSLGVNAVPIRDQTERKFRTATEEFAMFRKSDDITTVTAEEADAWLEHMLAKGELSNNTIGQRIQNVRTVIGWARTRSLNKLFPNGNPLEPVTLPSYQTVASDARTFTLSEAKQVLKAARKETAPELRWLPWMCAYSGARIKELAQLTRHDFFQVGNEWFFRITTAGGKTLKTRTSERRVPIHPDLIKEGLIDFVTSLTSDGRIFPPRTQPNISEWLREDVGIKRTELAPNHGWRHLFEDMCMVGGVIDAARNYITGRATGQSGEGYGKSEAMLPGLANEMRKIPSYI